MRNITTCDSNANTMYQHETTTICPLPFTVHLFCKRIQQEIISRSYFKVYNALVAVWDSSQMQVKHICQIL